MVWTNRNHNPSPSPNANPIPNSNPIPKQNSNQILNVRTIK